MGGDGRLALDGKISKGRLKDPTNVTWPHSGSPLYWILRWVVEFIENKILTNITHVSTNNGLQEDPCRRTAPTQTNNDI